MSKDACGSMVCKRSVLCRSWPAAASPLLVVATRPSATGRDGLASQLSRSALPLRAGRVALLVIDRRPNSSVRCPSAHGRTPAGRRA